MTDPLRLAARAVQRKLEAFYRLDPGPDVSPFVQVAQEAERERLLVREEADGLALALVLPHSAPSEGATLHDPYLQLVEGVSHFVYLTERARTDLPATELELELQAEVDKFVLFAFDGPRFASERTFELRSALYERVRYLHPETTEEGRRYRLANSLAARFSTRLMEKERTGRARAILRRFYRAGQMDKIHLATAA